MLVDQARHRMQVRVGGRVTREVEIGLGQGDRRGKASRGRSGGRRSAHAKGIYFVVDKQKGNFGGQWGEYYGGHWIKVNYPGPADAAWGVRKRCRRQATPRRRSWRPGANAS